MMKRNILLGALALCAGCQAAPSVSPVATAPIPSEKKELLPGQPVMSLSNLPRAVEITNFKRHLLQVTPALHHWNISIGGERTVVAGTNIMKWTHKPTGEGTFYESRTGTTSNYTIHLQQTTAQFQDSNVYKVIYQVPADRVLIFQPTFPTRSTAHVVYHASYFDGPVRRYIEVGVKINNMPAVNFDDNANYFHDGTNPLPDSSSTNKSRFLVYGPGDTVIVSFDNPYDVGRGYPVHPGYTSFYYYIWYMFGFNAFPGVTFYPLIDLYGYTASWDAFRDLKPLVAR